MGLLYEEWGEIGMHINWENFAAYNHDARGIRFKLKTCAVSYSQMRISLEIRSLGIFMQIQTIMGWRQSLFMMKRISAGLGFKRNFLIRM